MNPFLTIFLGLIPIIGLPALLIGLFAVTTGRKGGQLKISEDADRNVLPAPADGLSAATALDLQLTAVLAESGDVLLGYRTTDDPAAGLRSSTDVFPLATGILLVRPGDNDGDTAFSTLYRWSQDGIELTLRAFDDTDIVDLCDRRTSQRLVLNLLRPPCD